MNYSGTEELFTLEAGAPNYNQFLVKLFKNIFEENGVSRESSILDFGAGIGTLADIFTQEYGYEVSCLEIDKKQELILKKRGYKLINDVTGEREKYRGIYMSNVLEHIEHDEAIIKTITENLLEIGGVLIVYVPALPRIYSPLDKKLGHFRRYTKQSLTLLANQLNLEILRLEYMDSLGVLGWMIQKRLSLITGRITPNQFLVSIYDSLLFPISRFLDHILLKRFFGKNLLVVFTVAN